MLWYLQAQISVGIASKAKRWLEPLLAKTTQLAFRHGCGLTMSSSEQPSEVAALASCDWWSSVIHRPNSERETCLFEVLHWIMITPIPVCTKPRQLVGQPSRTTTAVLDICRSLAAAASCVISKLSKRCNVDVQPAPTLDRVSLRPQQDLWRKSKSHDRITVGFPPMSRHWRAWLTSGTSFSRDADHASAQSRLIYTTSTWNLTPTANGSGPASLDTWSLNNCLVASRPKLGRKRTDAASCGYWTSSCCCHSTLCHCDFSMDSKANLSSNRSFRDCCSLRSRRRLAHLAKYKRRQALVRFITGSPSLALAVLTKFSPTVHKKPSSLSHYANLICWNRVTPSRLHRV